MALRSDHRESITLHCFSPIVTTGTFLIEAALAIFVVFRYRHTSFGRLSAIVLALLAVFQLAETMICRGGGVLWTPVAWIGITFLPVLGVHLASLVVGRSRWVPIGYGLGILFVAAFVLNNNLISAVGCPGNYVSFIPTSQMFHAAYFMYYAAFTAIGIVLLLRSWLRVGAKRNLVGWMLIGYGVYIIPAAFVYAFLQEPPESFPSVFCGFAVFLAVIFVSKVLPAAHRTDRPA